ncbi:uncharacterized protein A4U43_C03F27210 [Asparagus officinalis]|uniref:Uncharacterized protein n=1 Tax=Asparagus officinalis TaxID=4686 RepID=A0A5P1FF87_ASPOF|nr:uncharacterized protein A4U43_C03F27210 [Asparagus officinalis]
MERVTRDFRTALRDSVQMVLEEGCPFSEFRMALQMYLDNLHLLASTDTASSLEKHMKEVGMNVDRLLTLRSQDPATQVSEHVQTILKEREQFLMETTAKEARLLGEVERIATGVALADDEH